MTFRQAFCKALDRALRRRLNPLGREDWAASALVVAPHPDDETLGCGGVICRKVASGAEVHLAFVTDGAASHAGLVPRETLATLRRREAQAAARHLGVAEAAVSFLGFPDGMAERHVPEIAVRLEALLRELRPASVFVVHRGDPSPDHLAAHRALASAIRRYGAPITVFEYPVWYWYHWPWVRLGQDLPGMRRRNLAQTARTMLGLMSLARLNTIADISSTAAAKRNALAAHASQTRRPDLHKTWPVLGDLGGGDFLARLLADHETFLRYDANA